MSLEKPRPPATRRYPRLTLRVSVSLELGDRCLETVATTLGAGGLYVASDEPLPADTPLIATFRIPGQTQLQQITARVAWCTGAATPKGGRGMGIEFIDAGARARLAEQLESWAQRRG